MEAEIADLQMECKELRVKFDALYQLVFNALPVDAFSALLKAERDHGHWFAWLKYAVKKYLVILTVKDTPGNAMPPDIVKDIVDAGFTQFRTDLWRTYIGVINQGHAIAQVFHENEVRSDYAYEALDGSFKIRATSQAWRQGNCGDIEINGKNYAVNLRGVNLVLYDSHAGQVVDSVGLDSHDVCVIEFKHLG